MKNIRPGEDGKRAQSIGEPEQERAHPLPRAWSSLDDDGNSSTKDRTAPGRAFVVVVHLLLVV